MTARRGYKRIIALLLVSALPIGTALTASPSASAATCESGSSPSAKILTKRAVYVGNKGNRVYGQAGGTIQVKVGSSWTTTGSLTVTGTAGAGVVFANVSMAVGVSVSYARQTTTEAAYSWKVPKTQNTGWVERGNYGWTGKYEQYYFKAPCKRVLTGTGSYKGATSIPWFIHS
jgi:hypothetical protein